METSYKALIAVACVAIIAVAGLLFTRDHQTNIAREAGIKAAQSRADCELTISKHPYREAAAIRDWCADNGY